MSMNCRTGAARESRSAAAAATVAARRIARALGAVRDAARLRLRSGMDVRVRGSMAPPRRQADRLREDRPGNRWVGRTAFLWLLLGLGLLGAPGALHAQTPDTTAPRVVSIERHTPSTSPTNADLLQWTVTFSEPVANVNSSDVSVTGTTVAPRIFPVLGSTTAYRVELSGGNLANLNGTVTLSFAATQNIRDAAGNALTNTTPTGTNDNSYVVDNIAPTVTITGVPAASSAPFTATFTFSESMTGFALEDIFVFNGVASNFTVDTAATPENSVFTAQISPSAAGAMTVDVAAHVATDAAGNGNTGAAQAASTYTAPLTDTTAPQVVSIERRTPSTSPTNSDTLTWYVTFSESVTNVDAADFSVTGTTAPIRALPATGSTTVYTVGVTGGDLADLNGTVTLSFATGHGIQDAAGNALTNTTPTAKNENTFVVDNIAPTVTSIERRVPLTSPTNEDTLQWTVFFSESVTNVDAADFSVTGTTGDLAVLALPGGADIYVVQLTGGDLADLNGTVTLSFAATQDIEDEAGHALTSTTPTGDNENTYVVDNAAPTVAITGVPATSSAPFTARFTFSESVTGFALADIAVGNGAASAFAVDATATPANTVFTALITPTANGAVTVDVAADAAMDAAGNGNTAAAQASSTYTDPSAPRVMDGSREPSVSLPDAGDTGDAMRTRIRDFYRRGG